MELVLVVDNLRVGPCPCGCACACACVHISYVYLLIFSPESTVQIQEGE